MTHYYEKRKKRNVKSLYRIASVVFIIAGCAVSFYIFLPLISWYFYFGPMFASPLAVPIPKTRVVRPNALATLFTLSTTSRIDYTNARNWFPTIKLSLSKAQYATDRYTISIPRIDIEHATVSTTDYDLSKHLVHYAGTPLPPENGNAVIFGHSTLPQLFNPKDYKTIFANLYRLVVGDKVEVTLEGVLYRYRVYRITIVDPDDVSVFSQNYSEAEITLVTCTPPGTVWKRLLVRARLERL